MQGQIEQGQKSGKQWPTFLALAALLGVALGVIIYQIVPRHQKPVSAPEQGSIFARVDNLLGEVKAKVAAEKPLQISEKPVRLPKSESALIPQEASASTSGAEDPSTTLHPQTASDVSLGRLDLRGIIWRAADPLALINGSVVGVKEKIAGYTVVSITTDQIVLKGGEGQRCVLHVDDKRLN